MKVGRVSLSPPNTVEEVDDEIISVANCFIGFMGASVPPHVLQVNEGTDIAKLGVEIDDIVEYIGGVDTRALRSREELVDHLKKASHLDFSRGPQPKEITAPASVDANGIPGQKAVDLEEDDDVLLVGTPVPKPPRLAPGPPRKQRREADGDSEAKPPASKRPKVVLVSREAKRAKLKPQRRALSPESLEGSVDGDRETADDESGSDDDASEDPAVPGNNAVSPAHPRNGFPSVDHLDRHGTPAQSTFHYAAAGQAPVASRPAFPAVAPPASATYPYYGHPYAHPAQPGAPPAAAAHPVAYPVYWHHPPPRPGAPAPWYGSQVPPPSAPKAAAGGRARWGSSPRFEQNDSGGFALVAERVPPRLLTFDALNNYFETFGPVVQLQLNRTRHECIVSFRSPEAAEAAMQHPVLNDPSIHLRPWRKRSPPPQQDAPSTAGSTTAAASAPGVAPSVAAPGVAPVAAPAAVPVAAASGAAAVPLVPSSTQGAVPASEERQQSQAQAAGGNLQLESGQALEKKRQRMEIATKKKAILQSLTDQMKAVLAKINDPATPEAKQEQLQAMLSKIREKITALTPSRDEQIALASAAPTSKQSRQSAAPPPAATTTQPSATAIAVPVPIAAPAASEHEGATEEAEEPGTLHVAQGQPAAAPVEEESAAGGQSVTAAGIAEESAAAAGGSSPPMAATAPAPTPPAESELVDVAATPAPPPSEPAESAAPPASKPLDEVEQSVPAVRQEDPAASAEPVSDTAPSAPELTPDEAPAAAASDGIGEASATKAPAATSVVDGGSKDPSAN